MARPGDSIVISMRDYVRSAQFRADANVAPSRAVVRQVQNLGSDYSITATSFTAVDESVLSDSIACSGTRPVLLTIAAVAQPGTNVLRMSVLWDGTEVTGATDGMTRASVANPPHCHGVFVVGNGDGAVPSVAQGFHRFSLAACVDAGTGTVFASSGYTVVLMAREI